MSIFQQVLNRTQMPSIEELMG